MNLKLTIADGNHDELEGRIRDWLLAHTAAYEGQRRKGYVWCSTEQLVLETGTTFRSNIWDMTVADLTPGECFHNAFIVAQINPGWRYYEGWALMPFSLPTHHAWAVDDKGCVQDPTWKPLYRRYKEADEASGKGQRYSGDVVYIGVTPDPLQHLNWTLSRRLPNLLSVGEMDVDDVVRHGLEAALRG